MLELVQETKFNNWNDLIKKYTSKAKRNEWLNIGGQLMPLDIVNTLKEKIKKELLNLGMLYTIFTANNQPYTKPKKYIMQLVLF
jgi:acyl-CoA-binding protein